MKHSFDFDTEDNDGNTIHCSGYVTDGRPAVMYLSNGDPGYPEEPAEVEFEAMDATDEDGNDLPDYPFDFDDLEEKAFENADYEDPCAEDYDD